MLKEQAVAHHLPLPVDEILKDYRSPTDPVKPLSSDAVRFLVAEPNAESTFDAANEMMREVDPAVYPKIM